MATLDELLVEVARQDPKRPLLVMGNEAPVEALPLLRRVESAAAFLERAGIGPGDRLAMCGQNSLAWAVWLLAAAWRGAAIVALHPGSTSSELAAALDLAEPQWLVLDENARGRSLAAIFAEIAHDPARKRVLRGTTVMPVGDGRCDLDAVVDRSSTAPAPCARLDLALALLFTSGSSGRPKLVSLSHRALLANARSTADAAGIGPEDRIASPLPLHHSAGLSSGLLLSLVTGALWCSTHRFEATTTLAQIGSQRCTVLQGVPTMFNALMEASARRGEGPCPTLRVGFVGGAPCAPDLLPRAHHRLGIERLCVVYGQTETGPTIAMAHRRIDEPAQALGLVGDPVAGVELRVVEPSSGQDLEPGAAGEILVRSPGCMDGYFGDAAASAAVMSQDGWLRTGDLGRILDAGLSVDGRVKQIIIRGGENVSPAEVEFVLREAPAVADVCVVPVASAHWGETICAVIAPTSADALDIPALQRICEQHLARYKRPDHYVVLDRLPLLSSGKVDRQAIASSLIGRVLT